MIRKLSGLALVLCGVVILAANFVPQSGNQVVAEDGEGYWACCCNPAAEEPGGTMTGACVEGPDWFCQTGFYIDSAGNAQLGTMSGSCVDDETMPCGDDEGLTGYLPASCAWDGNDGDPCSTPTQNLPEHEWVGVCIQRAVRADEWHACDNSCTGVQQIKYYYGVLQSCYCECTAIQTGPSGDTIPEAECALNDPHC